MVSWMERRMAGWVAGKEDGCVGGWLDGKEGGWVDGKKDGWVDGWMERMVAGWLDGKKDGWVGGGWVDSQRDELMVNSCLPLALQKSVSVLLISYCPVKVVSNSKRALYKCKARG